MICAACSEPLGHPWDQCNATPDVSYHRDCCPGCEQPPKRTEIEFQHGTANGYTNYACRCDPCRAAGRRINLRRYEAHPETRNLRRGVRT